jgi:hypothetical protein
MRAYPSRHQSSRIYTRRPRNLFQLRFMFRFPIHIPMIQTFLGLNAQRLIALLDNPLHISRTQILDFALVAGNQITVVLIHMYEDIHCSCRVAFL